MLCHFTDAYWGWASHHLQNSTGRLGEISREKFLPTSVFYDCLQSSQTGISAQHVWDIVARWQGLAVIRQLYLHPLIQKSFRKAVSEHFDHPGSCFLGEPFEDGEDCAVQNGLDRVPLESWEGRSEDIVVTQDAASFNERFYVALTGCWLNHEAERLTSICYDKTASGLISLRKAVLSLEHVGKQLPELLHMVEVHDFAFSFLLWQTPPGRADTYSSWVSGNDDHEDYRFVLVDVLRYTLSPADMIDLLILSSHWQSESRARFEWSRERKFLYLKSRLAFDRYFIAEPTIEDVQEDARCRVIYQRPSIVHVLKQMLNKWTGLPAQEHNDLCYDYLHMWQEKLRGTAVEWTLSTRDILSRVLPPFLLTGLRDTEMRRDAGGEKVRRDMDAEIRHIIECAQSGGPWPEGL